MSTYFITGVSRGIGWEFLRQTSANPSNTVIGRVRNKPVTVAKVTAELAQNNIHIIEGDITSYESLENAAKATSAITGGSLDYLIANAAALPGMNVFDGFGILYETLRGAKDPQKLQDIMLTDFTTNAVANVHLFNLFIPLILKGKQKKVIAISSGLSDLEMTRLYDIEFNGPYSASKAALNSIVAKFSARYREQGVLFLSVCPGMVDTGNIKVDSEEDQQKIMITLQKFSRFAPNFAKPETPQISASRVIAVFENASIEKGDGGVFLSQYGNKSWL